MDRLYDASAFFNLLFHEAPRHDHFVGQAVLDLTAYELGNALLRRYKDSTDDMLKLFNKCAGILAGMYMVDIRSLEYDVALTGSSTGLTFYDSAYVVAAERGGPVPVTDDAEMSAVARRRGIPTISSAEA